MNGLSLVDVFFIVTGAAVIIIALLLAVALIYIIAFARSLKQLAKMAQRTTEVVSADIQDLSDNIREQGFSLKALGSFVKNFGKRRITRKK
jgi:hypothetical protein